jgi:hypothetical protein
VVSLSRPRLLDHCREPGLVTWCRDLPVLRWHALTWPSGRVSHLPDFRLGESVLGCPMGLLMTREVSVGEPLDAEHMLPWSQAPMLGLEKARRGA